MKKNVLFVLTDDQRFNTIHALGNPDVITPTMDWLVENGTAFTQAHIPCGTCGAVCMPSRAMLNTGRTLFHLEGEGQTIPLAHTTLGEMFKEAGYRCFGTGKWHNGPDAFTRSFHDGENIFFGGMWDHWNVPVCHYDATGEYDNVIDFVVDFWNTNEVTKVHCDAFNPGVHSSTLLTNTAIQYLQQRPAQAENPFFLYLAYLAPHDPRTMPQKYKDMYDPDKLTLPQNCMTEHPFLFGVENIRDEKLAAYPRTETELRRQLAEYYGMITHLDAELGRVIDTLREKDQLKDTIIVFAADNGLGMGSHGLMGKQNHYEVSVRVPLIFCGPDIPAGQRVEQYVYLLDVFPTLCELIGQPVPVSVEGKSFAAMLHDPSVKTRQDLYFAYNDLLRSVKKEGWKLIEYRGPAHRTQLFNLNEDPLELDNLVEKLPDKVGELRQLMQRYRADWEDGGHRYSQNFWQNF